MQKFSLFPYWQILIENLCWGGSGVAMPCKEEKLEYLWHNFKANSNPKIIASYVIELVTSLKICLQNVRADCGTENVLQLQCNVSWEEITLKSYVVQEYIAMERLNRIKE